MNVMLKSSINGFFRRFRNYWIHGIIEKGRLVRFPRTLIVEAANICSLQCKCCPTGNNDTVGRVKGIMSCETFDKIMENIDVPLKSVSLYLHGEPFLCKDLAYFVERLKAKNIVAVIYSNGYKIDMDLLEQILKLRNSLFHFSMDISSKEHYEEIRYPGKFDAAVTSLESINEMFAKYNSRYEISVIDDENSTCTREEMALGLFEKYSNLSMVTVNTRFPWPRYFYMGDLSGKIDVKDRFCKESIAQLAIAWNGDALFCSYDYGGELVVGSILDTKLSELYNSEIAVKYRKLHFMGKRNDIPLCKECVLPRFYGTNVKFNRKDLIK